MKKLAVCDFDGTLSKGYISMEFLDHVHNKGLHNGEAYKEQMHILTEHKKGRLGYGAWCKRWGELWAEGLKGQRVDDIAKEAIDFFRKFKANTYPNAYKLMEELAEQDYHIICLSLGAFEVINLAATDLKMDETYATKPSSDRGFYTGSLSTNLHEPQGKEELLRKILRQKTFRTEASIGMGDSHTDIGFMSMLEIPIATNPSQKMKEHAQTNNWSIVDLNMALKLENLLNDSTR